MDSPEISKKKTKKQGYKQKVVRKRMVVFEVNGKNRLS